MNQFQNKICLVTGAASGIGKATAILFAQQGAKLALADVGDLSQTIEEVKKYTADIIEIKCNISNSTEVENCINTVVKHFGRLDCAVNSAGIAGTLTLPTHLYTNDAWEQMLNINLTGTWYCLKYQIAQMLLQGGGNIVCVSSAAGLRGQPENVPYAATKHAIVGMVKTASIEYATKNIRINAVCPTAIETPMIMEGRRKLAYNDEALENAKNYQTMKRLGQPEEVAAVALWLCSNDASFITGHAMPVDGGAFA